MKNCLFVWSTIEQQQEFIFDYIHQRTVVSNYIIKCQYFTTNIITNQIVSNYHYTKTLIRKLILHIYACMINIVSKHFVFKIRMKHENENKKFDCDCVCNIFIGMNE